MYYILELTTKMQNLFRRNRTFYIRLAISQELQPYFNSNSSYIRSLQTKNKKNATIIAKYLIAKFNYIKRSYMMLPNKEISGYIYEFKKVSYDDIINRNSYLSVEEIDDSIKELNSGVKIDNALIQKELHDLMQMLDSKHNLNSLYGFDTDDAEAFKKYIVQIKINALSDVKKSIKTKTSTNINTPTAPVVNTGTVTIKEAIDEYLTSKSGISEAVIEQDKLNLNRFIEWCDTVGITYIETLKHKNLISFRSYWQKLNPKLRPNTINRTLANISTFIKYCLKEEYILRDISKGIRLKLTICQQRS